MGFIELFYYVLGFVWWFCGVVLLYVVVCVVVYWVLWGIKVIGVCWYLLLYGFGVVF
jgi:hypothetical protein